MCQKNMQIDLAVTCVYSPLRSHRRFIVNGNRCRRQHAKQYGSRLKSLFCFATTPFLCGIARTLIHRPDNLYVVVAKGACSIGKVIMTTNVYDQDEGMLASDSRWSVHVDDYLFYVDNVGYEKIVYDTRLAVMFAGHLNIIDEWKRWFIAGREGAPPGVNEFLSLCIIDVSTGKVRMDHGMKISSSCFTARFAGTGAPHAFLCWVVNKDAVKCVATAVTLDRKSGGNIAFLRRNGLENNLNNHSTVSQVMGSLLTKGEMIMLNGNQSQVPMPIKDAVKDSAVNDAFTKVSSSGRASLGAPFMGMGTNWTEAEKSELYAILSEYPPEAKA